MITLAPDARNVLRVDGAGTGCIALNLLREGGGRVEGRAEVRLLGERTGRGRPFTSWHFQEPPYRLMGLRAGTSELRVLVAGLEAVESKVDVVPGVMTTIEITLHTR